MSASTSSSRSEMLKTLYADMIHRRAHGAGVVSHFRNINSWIPSGSSGRYTRAFNIPPNVYYCSFRNEVLSSDEIDEILQELSLVKSGAIKRVEGPDKEYVCYIWNPTRARVADNDPLIQALVEQSGLSHTERRQLDEIRRWLATESAWRFAPQEFIRGPIRIPKGVMYAKTECSNAETIEGFLKTPDLAADGIELLGRDGGHLYFIWRP